MGKRANMVIVLLAIATAVTTFVASRGGTASRAPRALSSRVVGSVDLRFDGGTFNDLPSGIVTSASGLRRIGIAQPAAAKIDFSRELVVIYLVPEAGECGAVDAPFTGLTRAGDVLTARFGPGPKIPDTPRGINCPADFGEHGAIALAVARRDVGDRATLRSCPASGRCTQGETLAVRDRGEFVVDGWLPDAFAADPNGAAPCVIEARAQATGALARFTLPQRLGGHHVDLASHPDGTPATAAYTTGPDPGAGWPHASELAATVGSPSDPGLGALELGDELRLESTHCVQQWLVERVASGSVTNTWPPGSVEALRIVTGSGAGRVVLDLRLLDATSR
jgi:hypothetical protein